jgi:tRNA dimethylallyltransferase
VRGEVALEIEKILLPTAALYARCDARVDAMMAAGAIDEVAALVERGLNPDLPVMRAIGVAELSRYINGLGDLEQAVAAIKQATRNYAKRQGTWLRHQLSA